MSTAVFAAGSGTKDDPYIVNDGTFFAYYCKEGGYIKVEAEKIDIYANKITITKDVILSELNNRT